jgi:hypothetical protein
LISPIIIVKNMFAKNKPLIAAQKQMIPTMTLEFICTPAVPHTEENRLD